MADPTGTVTLPEVTVEGKPAPVAPTPQKGLASPSTGMVAVTDKTTGHTTFVRPEDFQEALQEGYRPATENEFYGADMGAIGKASAVAIGAARSMSLGAFDPAMVAAARAVGGDERAEEMRRGLRIAHDALPDETRAGEIAGALVPLLVGDPLQAVDLGAGRATEAAVTGALGEGRVARAVGRAASGAVSNVLPGGIIGAGQELSEDTLGGHDITAENMLAASAKGMIVGGLLGGTLHAGFGAASDLAERYGGLAPSVEKAGEREGEAIYRSASAAPEEAAAEGDARGWLGKWSDEEAFKATGAKMADYKRIGPNGADMMDEARRLGGVAREEGIVTPLAKREDMAIRVEDRLGEVGKELGEMRRPLDTTSVRPSMANIVDQAEAKIMRPLEGLPQTEAERGVVGKWLDDMQRLSKGRLNEWGEQAGNDPTFDQLYKFRRRLDEVLRPQWEKGMMKPLPPAFQELQSLRGIIVDEYERAAGEAAKELGADFLPKYTMAKGLYGDLKTLQRILGPETAREASNHRIGLTDVIATLHGGVSGLAMGALNHVRRVYGNQLASHVLDKASRLEGVQRMNAHVDGLLKRGVRGFLTGGERSAPTLARESPKVTPETVQKIREAAASPEALASHVAAMVGGAGIEHAAPTVSGRLATTITKGVTYLASVAPKEPEPVGPSVVPQAPRAPSATDMQRFTDAVQAVDDPLSVVDDLRKGRLSRDKIEALKNVYPRLYERLGAEVAAQAAELHPKLSTQQEIGLSVLFGRPMTASMDPDRIAAFQQTFAKDEQQQTQKNGAGARKVRKLDREPGSDASAFDKLEIGE